MLYQLIVLGFWCVIHTTREMKHHLVAEESVQFLNWQGNDKTDTPDYNVEAIVSVSGPPLPCTRSTIYIHFS